MDLRPDDPVLEYSGAVSLERTDNGIAPWRVPHEEIRLYLPDGSIGRVATTSGIRIRLRTDAPSLICDYHIRATALQPEPVPGVVSQPPLLDVVCDGKLLATLTLATAGAGSVNIDGLPDGMTDLELWCPHLHQFRLRGLRLPPGSRASPPAPTGRHRWIHYSDSIGQGLGAQSPSTTWPALLADTLDLDLTSLAFGAACHLQPMFSRLIRSLPADLITMMVGLNTLAVGGFPTFAAQLVGFIQIIRESHPRTPVVLISPILFPHWENPPEGATESLPMYRRETRRVVELLANHGDTAIHYVDGLDVFGDPDGDLFYEPFPYSLHPSARGHRVLAAAVAAALRKIPLR